LVAGSGELFKYAFIGGRDMFDFIHRTFPSILTRDPDSLLQGIERSVRIKSGVVESDEKEAGPRAVLNFGHTFAHALETLYNYETILHGEAVILGLKCSIDLGKRITSIPSNHASDYDEILALLPPVRLPSKVNIDLLYDNMFSDKKAKANKLRFVLPTDPGSVVIRDDVPKEAVMETLGNVIGSKQ
jgi:3-dehydroquinate synthase